MKYIIIPLFSVLLTLSSCYEKSIADKYNIIFIMSDDHASKAMSCYDGTINMTPNLDRISRDGVIFRNSFVSNSICAPSRAVMLTGKHSHLNGQIHNGVEFDGSQETFPKMLQQVGYQTALIGKWHLRSAPTGFDYWNVLPGQGAYYNPDFNEMGDKKRHEGYVTSLITDHAIDWLSNKRIKDQPFCLLVHHKAPHRTWQPDTAQLSEFAEMVYPIPVNYFDAYTGRVAAGEQR